MRTRNVILACLAMLTMGSVQVQAQGLGGLLKKAKKVLDTVKEQTTTTSSDSKSQSSTASSTASGGQDGQTTQAIPLQGGGTLYNPFEKKLEVEFVGLYGTNKSMNFGDVSVVLKIKVKTVCDKISYIGDDKTTAYDDEGNVYRIKNTAYGIKVAEGISVKADLGTYGLYFVNVPKKTQKLQLVKLYLYNDFEDGNGAKSGYIELRDVPITWQR